MEQVDLPFALDPVFFQEVENVRAAAKRRQIYSEINDILLDESFVAVVTTYPPKMVTSSKLHDVVTPESIPSEFYFNDAWLEP